MSLLTAHIVHPGSDSLVRLCWPQRPRTVMTSVADPSLPVEPGDLKTGMP